MLNESVSEDEINDAIDNHKRVIINYHTKGEDKNTGARVAEVYAYGLTYGGNPVIRVFQPYGDTTTRVPGWKFMRLDRISAWQTTEQTFDTPANERYPGLGDFNSFGDKTMLVVYKIASFGNEQITNDNNPKEPKTKEDVYKTDTENNSEENNQNQEIPQTNNQPKIDRIPKEKTPEEKEKELDKLRNILKDKPISLSDFNKKMKEPQQTKWQDVFDDEAEKDLQQLHKNDMRNQRRRDNRWQKAVDSRPLGNRKGSLNRAFEK